MLESPSRRQFAEMMARADDEIDLAEAALLAACEEYPDLDVRTYLARLDRLADALGPRMAGIDGPASAAALHDLLAEEHGFHGNVKDYYDPRNSFLNDVMDRRTGIPITLSTVYMEVARRAGLSVDGVGLPGHFVVRVSGVLVDPFHEGAVLTHHDCQKRLDRIYGGRVKLDDTMLAPCDRRAIVARTLHNLKSIYVKAEDHRRALSVVELLLIVNPGSLEDLRDRGLIHAAMDCYALAAGELEDYLERAGHGPGEGELRAKIADLRTRAARLN